jgi:hypothetical protein
MRALSQVVRFALRRLNCHGGQRVTLSPTSGTRSVATIQFAITLGASVGGALFDGSGYQATFGFSAMLLIIAGALAMVASRTVHFHPRAGVTG